ncbi:replication restart helicase PriA [Thermosulfurimonas dismutans]|uniref:Replication restart protein PriA n=1 Tax=Thermosulfurimonas dismutans TaxID=999894 RepID=A0A179D4Z0_9BACT|nr:primosomal protein N' [Thermosulfurimonas dismutans]OAQ21164.1 Helicase PriA essential for oriC/DnaA-independent DNA replication [Thermosulfurimonas dismutans]
MYFYEIVLPLPLYTPLIYASSKEIPCGVRVLVPVRGRRCVGLVFRRWPEGESPDFQVREIEEIVDDEPLLPADLLEFLAWCWEYYLHPPGEVVRSAFPPGFFREIKKKYVLTAEGKRLLSEGALPGWAEHLKRPRTLKNLIARAGRDLSRELDVLVERGLVKETEDLSGLKPPFEPWLEYLAEEVSSPIEEFLKEKGRWPKRFLEESFGKEPVKKLVSSGRVRLIELPRMRRGVVLDSGEPPVPNLEQTKAVEAIKEALDKGFEVFLLHGITGSGKTLVYLYAAEAALRRGKSVLILVPEIALTPYVETHFVSRFGTQVAILHSALPPRARAAEWFRVARGEARVVVGTRSALFAPLRDLGLIVVDEEHESSYKQMEGLRYQARDMALMRGKLAEASVVLGSATPSVKSYYLAKTGKYRLLTLTQRPKGKTLPEIEVVGLKRPGELFTERLLSAINETLSQGQQVLLFLNRRGYAPIVFCKDCGEPLMCPNCTLSLTYYRSQGRLLCHHCGFERPAFPLCPHCEGKEFRLVGFGTERVEAEIMRIFPSSRVARLDRETVTSERKLLELIRRLKRGEIDILVGTQMVAQGHDLPGVSLVGVLWAEGGLHFPDFRAAERTFQLLVQVAGRAGRGRVPGRVILQTRMRDHYAISAALKQDYEAFFEEDLKRRKTLRFPPFSRLALLIFSALKSEKAESAAHKAREFLSAFKNTEVLGPVPAPLFRLSARYRWQLLLKAETVGGLDRALKAFWQARDSLIPAGVRLTLDRDPEELL